MHINGSILQMTLISPNCILARSALSCLQNWSFQCMGAFQRLSLTGYITAQPEGTRNGITMGMVLVFSILNVQEAALVIRNCLYNSLSF